MVPFISSYLLLLLSPLGSGIKMHICDFSIIIQAHAPRMRYFSSWHLNTHSRHSYRRILTQFSINETRISHLVLNKISSKIGEPFTIRPHSWYAVDLEMQEDQKSMEPLACGRMILEFDTINGDNMRHVLSTSIWARIYEFFFQLALLEEECSPDRTHQRQFQICPSPEDEKIHDPPIHEFYWPLNKGSDVWQSPVQSKCGNYRMNCYVCRLSTYFCIFNVCERERERETWKVCYDNRERYP